MIQMADGSKSNGQRLFEAFKRIKKHGMGMKSFPNLRPSEIMMMHSILHCLKKRAETSGCPLKDISADNTDKSDPVTVNGVTISELSEFTQMTPSAVSQTVKALEEKGYIERTMNSSDRRLVFVTLSKQGYQIFQEAEKVFMDYLDNITELLGKEDTDRLIGLLEKLADILPPASEIPPVPNR